MAVLIKEHRHPIVSNSLCGWLIYWKTKHKLSITDMDKESGYIFRHLNVVQQSYPIK